jgi:hypothetical protein
LLFNKMSAEKIIITFLTEGLEFDKMLEIRLLG